MSALLAAPRGLSGGTSGQGGVCWSPEEALGRAGLSLSWPLSALALGGWQLAGEAQTREENSNISYPDASLILGTIVGIFFRIP